MTVATIGMHKGTQAHQAHNRRDPKVADKLEHIDREKHNITGTDIDVRKAYENIFGDAVKKYNDGQKRADRKIGDYYEKVCKDKRLNPVYEYIVGVYPKQGSISEEENVKILKEFCDRFCWKYDHEGSLRVIGEYIHLDETNPHVHLDYIPVGSGYKKGMSLQVSQERALNEMGFYSEKYSETALVKWEADVNELMEEICKEHGIEVIHPDRGKGREHLETEAYKAQKELERIEQKAAIAEDKMWRDTKESERLYRHVVQDEKTLERLSGENKSLTERNKQLSSINENIENQIQLKQGYGWVEPQILKEKKDSVTISRNDYNVLTKRANDFVQTDKAFESFLNTDFSREYQTFLALKQQQENDTQQAKRKLENARAEEKKVSEQKAFWSEQGLTKYAAGLEQDIKRLKGELNEVKKDYNDLANDYNELCRQIRQRDYDDYEL